MKEDESNVIYSLVCFHGCGSGRLPSYNVLESKHEKKPENRPYYCYGSWFSVGKSLLGLILRNTNVKT